MFHRLNADVLLICQSRGTLRRKAPKKVLNHHLYLMVRDFGYRIGDDVEIYFYLYDAHPSRQRQITERFLVKISKDGFPTFVDLPHSNCTVFTDLGKFKSHVNFIYMF